MRKSALLLISPYQRIKELVKRRMRKLRNIRSYQDLLREITRMWNMRTVQVVPIVVGSLRIVTKNLDKGMGKLNVKISISLPQKTTLLGTARILRKLLEL